MKSLTWKVKQKLLPKQSKFLQTLKQSELKVGILAGDYFSTQTATTLIHAHFPSYLASTAFFHGVCSPFLRSDGAGVLQSF